MTTSDVAARVLVETLKLSRNSGTVAVDELATKARVSREIVVSLLFKLLGDCGDHWVTISRGDRFRIAMFAAENGWLDSTARGLSWQEFEQLAEECLRLAGFEARRNVRVKDEERSWQIDVVGTRSRLVLSIDCKHWKPPNYASKFKKASSHQRTATAKLLAQKTFDSECTSVGLPVILTLHDLNRTIVDGVVMLPVQKLPDFLSNITPFTPGLPFLLQGDPVQNPIRAATVPPGDRA